MAVNALGGLADMKMIVKELEDMLSIAPLYS